MQHSLTTLKIKKFRLLDLNRENGEIYENETVLSSLHLLPPALQALLSRFPLHFIYGSVAADISLAKKYVPAGRATNS